MFEDTHEQALKSLLYSANQGDDEGRRVANFLLCWLDPKKYGRVSIDDIWDAEEYNRRNMIIFFPVLANKETFDHAHIYDRFFERIIARHRY